MAKAKKNDEIKFEAALEKLELIADELSRGDLDLDKALAKYEEGAKLLKLCHEALATAEEKIKLVIKKNDGTYRLEDFDKSKDKEDTTGMVDEDENIESSTDEKFLI